MINFSLLRRRPLDRVYANNISISTEYITTLESHIADRDRLIEAIRQELGASKIENDELRQEVNALKQVMAEGRATVESLALPPPAPLDANGDVIRPISPVPTARATTKLNKPNTRKDMPAHSNTPFWGGMGAFGGVTPVHATLVPDITLPPAPRSVPSTSDIISGKLSSSSWGTGWWAPREQQENINPRLNVVPSMFNSPGSSDSEFEREKEMNALRNGVTGSVLNGGFPGMTRFDAFMELNPFTIKSADDYKMHLYAQMVASRQYQQQPQQQQQQQQQSSDRFAQPSYGQQQPQQNTNTLLNGVRPKYFQQSSSKTEAPQSPKSTLAALLSGKALASSSSSSSRPFASSSSPASTSSSVPSPTQQQAYVAALASQTLLSRMSSAFWDAFSGSSASPSSSSIGARSSMAPSWDAEKVRKVLEGRAVVRVVDIDPPVVDEKESLGLGLGLEEKMRGLSLRKC